MSMPPCEVVRDACCQMVQGTGAEAGFDSCVLETVQNKIGVAAMIELAIGAP
jgi:hypothetical protein